MKSSKKLVIEKTLNELSFIKVFNEVISDFNKSQQDYKYFVGKDNLGNYFVVKELATVKGITNIYKKEGVMITPNFYNFTVFLRKINTKFTLSETIKINKELIKNSLENLT